MVLCSCALMCLFRLQMGLAGSIRGLQCIRRLDSSNGLVRDEVSLAKMHSAAKQKLEIGRIDAW